LKTISKSSKKQEQLNQMLHKPSRVQSGNTYEKKRIQKLGASRVAKDFLAENRITTIDWPSNCPDLNSIENMWQIIKNKVEIRMPKNVIKQFLAEEWELVPQETVNNLITSMKTRCELVLEKNGDRVPY
jgi:transposase